MIKSGMWVGATRILQRVMSFCRSIVLARLLSPEDFGLFGMALLTLATIDTFSQTGFRQALIQRPENTQTQLNTAWTVELCKGCMIAALLYLLAPYAALFFNVPDSEHILRVIAIGVVVQHATNIAIVAFEKELAFHKYFLFAVAGTVCEIVVSITVALIIRNVWALVVGRIAGEVVRCGISYILIPWKPRFMVNYTSFRELFSFGKWVLGSGILTFLLTQGDDILVGRLLGAGALGLYQMAYLISNIPATEVSHLISQITFPAYAKIQNRAERLRENFLIAMRGSAFLSFFAAGIVFSLGRDFIKLFMGAQWLPVVPALKVLCIFGITRSMNATLGTLFMAAGNPRIITKAAAGQLLMLALIIAPLTMLYNITGTSIAVVIPNALAFLFLAVQLCRCMKITRGMFFKVVCPSAFGCFALVFVLYGITAVLDSVPEYPHFFIKLFAGAFVYPGAVVVIDKRLGGDLLKTFIELRSHVRLYGS